jgi:hypothetical protein
MHFIGNRAIVLGEGEPHVQAMYNVAFTGTSFVLPVVVLLFAFYAVGVEEKAGYLRILVGACSLVALSAVCTTSANSESRTIGAPTTSPTSWAQQSLPLSPVLLLWASSSAGELVGLIAGGDEESVHAYWRVLSRACIGLRLLGRSIGITTA